jgi:flagellar assembly protein FliH
LAEAQDAAAVKAAAALEVVAKGVSVLIAAQDAAVAQTQREAIAALRVIVAKALPALAAKGAGAEIEAFVKKCLAEALDEPRVVLRVANDVYEPVCSQIEAVAAATGYPGRIVLLADETLAGGDARLEWADGGAERKLDHLLGEVDAAMTRNADPAAAAIPPSPSGDNA